MGGEEGGGGRDEGWEGEEGGMKVGRGEEGVRTHTRIRTHSHTHIHIHTCLCEHARTQARTDGRTHAHTYKACKHSARDHNVDNVQRTKQSDAAAISVRTADTAINVFVYRGFNRGSLYGTSDTNSTASPATRPLPLHCGQVRCTPGGRTPFLPPGLNTSEPLRPSCTSPLIPLVWLEKEPAWFGLFFCKRRGER